MDGEGNGETNISIYYQQQQQKGGKESANGSNQRGGNSKLYTKIYIFSEE